MALISVTQFAKKHNQDVGRTRRLILEGRIPATKIGSQWAIEEDTPWPADQRVKSGKYVNWRKKDKPEAEESPTSD